MILTETAPAAVTPVSAGELSAHLRLAHGFPDDGAEDALLELYLRNAAAAVETRTGRALIRRGFVLRLAAWDREGHVTLPIGPVEAIASLRFVRGAEATEAPAGSWTLQPGTGRQKVTGADGAALPPIPQGHVAELGFDAGFGTAAADVPGDLRQAVLLLAANYYERRHESEGPVMPMTVRGLLEPWRPVRV